MKKKQISSPLSHIFDIGFLFLLFRTRLFDVGAHVPSRVRDTFYVSAKITRARRESASCGANVMKCARRKEKKTLTIFAGYEKNTDQGANMGDRRRHAVGDADLHGFTHGHRRRAHRESHLAVSAHRHVHPSRIDARSRRVRASRKR